MKSTPKRIENTTTITVELILRWDQTTDFVAATVY